MKQEYGPTIRQKARKLIGDLPRNGMKPSQYLSQLEDEVRDVKLDDVKREHLLKTIPPRIREIMGKVVETKTAAEVAKMADQYFDSQGRILQRSCVTLYDRPVSFRKRQKKRTHLIIGTQLLKRKHSSSVCARQDCESLSFCFIYRRFRTLRSIIVVRRTNPTE